ncbi:MAG: nucleotidyltransferase domain-containing protein [Candidatus Tectomicrobia bacterium]|uniref:Nucleotidyltransferase domain-containing protein n=1 Tax=Tectimicrobiota bacterium TaxID=2528274 RepID=A0A933LRN0_UNCTE|nr:nucleotidyltransferase domain-containing protein [Candidatus Tectomicrobia bacterium]
MAKSKAEEAIRYFEERLKASCVSVSKIILFGSQARGNAFAESDVDILLISSDFSNKDIYKRLEMIKEAEIATIKKFMIPLDVIMMTPEEFNSGSSLVSSFAQNGKVISF